MAYKIKFGTDGWRGVIAEDYTFDNVRRCTQGFATYLLEQGRQGQWVIVGHDKRFQSENFVAAVAEVLAGNGLNVYLTNGGLPGESGCARGDCWAIGFIWVFGYFECALGD